MTEQRPLARDEHVVIHSRRGRLFAQAAAVSVVGVGAGIVLQSWSVIRSSPLGRVSDSTGLPVIAVVVSLVAVWLGVTMARDGWNYRVVLGPGSLTIQDAHGTFSVPYADVDSVTEVPLGGVAIAFCDPDAWLSSLSTAAELRGRTSAVLRHAHGADVLLPANALHVGATAFVALLTARLETDKG